MGRAETFLCNNHVKPKTNSRCQAKGRARGERETTKVLFSKCNRISRHSPRTDRNNIVLNKYQKEKEKPSSEETVTYYASQFAGRTKSAGNGNFATRVLFVTRKQIFY